MIIFWACVGLLLIVYMIIGNSDFYINDKLNKKLDKELNRISKYYQ